MEASKGARGIELERARKSSRELERARERERERDDSGQRARERVREGTRRSIERDILHNNIIEKSSISYISATQGSQARVVPIRQESHP